MLKSTPQIKNHLDSQDSEITTFNISALSFAKFYLCMYTHPHTPVPTGTHTRNWNHTVYCLVIFLLKDIFHIHLSTIFMVHIVFPCAMFHNLFKDSPSRCRAFAYCQIAIPESMNHFRPLSVLSAVHGHGHFSVPLATLLTKWVFPSHRKIMGDSHYDT